MSGERVEIPPSKTSRASVIGDGEKVIYVEFEDGDKRNPQNYPLLRKWAITLIACYYGGATSAASSAFSISTSSMKQDLNCTELQAALGLGLYTVGFALVPLVTSSFSEEFGRRPVYIFSSFTFTLTLVMIALAPNISVVIAGRALGGIFSSTGVSLIGGSIADIWRPHERGLPMTIFAFSTVFSLGLGSVIGGVIQSSLGWRWVQWIQVMLSSLFTVIVMLSMGETRSSIILIQIARSQRKITGNIMYKARAEVDKENLWSLIKISCSRPVYFLLTEPIVQNFSMWCGFTWGIVYCLLEAVTPIFETTYGFSVQQTGYVYITTSIAAVIGFFANLYQDGLYRKHFSHRQQEARLYLMCTAALCLPVSMFIFAWTASPTIHWIAPVVGLSVFMSGVMIILQVTFLYLADCYNTYASSAQAGPSLFRNLLSLAFPLFTQRMFATLTYKWALTLFAALALLMAPTSFLLFFYGSRIRARSIASRKILAADVPQVQHASSSDEFVVVVEEHLATDRV